MNRRCKSWTKVAGDFRLVELRTEPRRLLANLDCNCGLAVEDVGLDKPWTRGLVCRDNSVQNVYLLHGTRAQ